MIESMAPTKIKLRPTLADALKAHVLGPDQDTPGHPASIIAGLMEPRPRPDDPEWVWLWLNEGTPGPYEWLIERIRTKTGDQWINTLIPVQMRPHLQQIGIELERWLDESGVAA